MRRRREAGQSLVECALVLPLLILLIVNVVNFGAFFYAWISVANAARTAAQYFTTAGVSIAAAVPPTASVVRALVSEDLKSLPNQSSIQVCVSTSNSTTVDCNLGTAPGGTPPAAETPEGDPAVTYLTGAIDVTYTYQPVIPTWSIPALHIYSTLPPTTLHRQVQMRVLQ